MHRKSACRPRNTAAAQWQELASGHCLGHAAAAQGRSLQLATLRFPQARVAGATNEPVRRPAPCVHATCSGLHAARGRCRAGWKVHTADRRASRMSWRPTCTRSREPRGGGRAASTLTSAAASLRPGAQVKQPGRPHSTQTLGTPEAQGFCLQPEAEGPPGPRTPPGSHGHAAGGTPWQLPRCAYAPALRASMGLIPGVLLSLLKAFCRLVARSKETPTLWQESLRLGRSSPSEARDGNRCPNQQSRSF